MWKPIHSIIKTAYTLRKSDPRRYTIQNTPYNTNTWQTQSGIFFIINFTPIIIIKTYKKVEINKN